MKNWERQEIAKELKKELANAKRCHKRYENKIAKTDAEKKELSKKIKIKKQMKRNKSRVIQT